MKPLCRILVSFAAMAILAACAPRVEDEGASAPSKEEETTTTSTAKGTPSSAGQPGVIVTPVPLSEKVSIESRGTKDMGEADFEPGKRGGSLTYITFGEGPKTFDPLTANESSSIDVLNRCFEGLIRWDPQKETYGPGLLEEYYMEPGNTTWTLKLREGLKWSDGHPFTADDILFTAQVIYDPKIITPARDTFQVAGKPVDFVRVDDRTVQAGLAAPCGSFHVMLASLAVVPKHILEPAYREGRFDTAWGINMDPSQFVCSGGFKLKQYTSGERVVLERNPHYYRRDRNGAQLPYLDTIVFGYVPDLDSMLLRFERGENDALMNPRPESIPDLADRQAKGGYTLYNCGPGEGANYFWFNLKPGNNPKNGQPYVTPYKAAIFANEEFRKAAHHALNKEAIVRTLLRGLAVSAWSQESPALRSWHNPNIPKYPYDPEKAKKTFDAIGLVDRNNDGIREDAQGNKVSFTFLTNKGNKVREEVASLLAADWKAVGIEAIPQFTDFNALVTAINDTIQYEACLLGFGGSTHPSTSMNTWRSSGRTHFINPLQEKPATAWEAEIDKLCDEFTTALDMKKQKEIVDRMQYIYAEHCGSIPLWTSTRFYAVRNTFGNIKPAAIADIILWNAEEIYRK